MYFPDARILHSLPVNILIFRIPVTTPFSSLLLFDDFPLNLTGVFAHFQCSVGTSILMFLSSLDVDKLSKITLEILYYLRVRIFMINVVYYLKDNMANINGSILRVVKSQAFLI